MFFCVGIIHIHNINFKLLELDIEKSINYVLTTSVSLNY